MKKYILLLLLLGVFFTGCGKDPVDEPLAYTAPTLPSFDTQTSPEEKLAEAIDALKAADSFQMTFGTGDVIQTLPNSADAIAQATALIPNTNFLTDLCREKITLSPSNTGSFTLSLNGLTGDDFSALTGIETQAESCCVSLTIAPEGYLSRLELQMDETVTFLQIDQVK